MLMSSNSYKPDDWEKPFYEAALKTAFPSDLIKAPGKYQDQLIHLVGIVDSVYIDSSTQQVNILLENHYWDYIEDYSIQDEVMFVSPKGDGKFIVTLDSSYRSGIERLKKFSAERKLFLVYGNFKEIKNGLPLINAVQLKYIDYEQYSTAIFTYEIKRNEKGEVETDKKGRLQTANFKFLKVAGAGQNK
jgi:hypothetical protein